MPTLETVIRLRRHAACLAGSAASGDRLIEACLPGLVALPEPVSFEAALRLLYEIAATRLPAGAQAGSSALARPFLQLSVEERGLILLTRIEGLSGRAAAAVLGRADAGAGEAAERAWQRLEACLARMPAHVVILEADGIMGLEIELLVRDMGHLATRLSPATPNPEPPERADVVILDLDQPVALAPTGHLQRMGLRRGIPMVLISARHGEARRPRRNARTRVVAKPFAAPALQRAVLDALAERRS